MSIEVTVSLTVKAALSFDVEPGTIITPEMLAKELDHAQRDRDWQHDNADVPNVYVIIESATEDSFGNVALDLYNRDTGADAQIVVGQAATA